MRRSTLLENSRLILVSPWLATAAISLLTLIIVVFAANNLTREKQHLTESLLRKGRDTILFVGANIRAQTMMGAPDRKQLQILLEQATEDPGIAFIALAGRDGVILAHSDPTKVGGTIDRPGEGTASGRMLWRTLPGQANGEEIFEVEAPFLPFEAGEGRGRRHMRMQNMMQRWLHEMDPAAPPFTENGQPPPPPFPRSFPASPEASAGRPTDSADLTITIGLGMKDLAGSIRQNYYQIIIMSVILLIVVLAGWLSLFIAQSYRLTRQSLVHMEAFTNLLISRLPVGIIATDKADAIKTMNQAAASITGIDPATAIGRTPDAVLPETIASLFRGNDTPATSDLTIERQSDQAREISAASVPVIDAEGENRGHVLLLHDLTNLKTLERQLRRHDRLIALGKMAAGVAHEVRNPLSSIKGFATLLAGHFPTDSEEGKTAGLLVREVDRLNRAITELLDYTRPLPLKKVPTDLAALAADALSLMKPEATSLGVICFIDTAQGDWILEVDPDRMRQVLLNLYLNALQAMPTGGTLTVAVGPGSTSGRLALSVIDSGCGIAPENLERTLDPYFTTKAEGTGLGLAIVAKIIDEHNGTITVTSRLGEGTTMTVELPTTATCSNA